MKTALSKPDLWSWVINGLLVWLIAACIVSIASSLLLTGEAPYHGLVDDPSWRGMLAAILLFLLMQAIIAVFWGTPCVFLSFAVFHGCIRVGLERWAILAVIIASVLLGAMIFWLFVETWNDHGDIAAESQWWSHMLPPVAATVATGIIMAAREQSATTTD